MMYLIDIIGQMHHLLNEPKKLVFTYNTDQKKYDLVIK